MIHDALLRYLLDLAQDPIRAQRFRSDPDAAMAGTNLSPEQKAILRSRDDARIRAALVDRPIEQDLMLFAWLGLLQDAEAKTQR